MSEAYYSDESVTLFLGKCETVLPDLPANSVDAIVTDPPAAIAFMGREWDGDRGGRAQWVAWLTECMAEALRVLKPGGHALVWSLPRTSHWTAWAIEDAGFDIRECVLHLFGCLTDDVDVLTERGWVRGIEVKAGERIAQWGAATGTISLAEVQETFRAPWSGDLARFRNSDTDQALTPNHRVWHRGVLWKRWSDYRVNEASEVSRRSPCRLPLAGLHDGPGIGGEDYAALLGWVWTEGGFDKGISTGVRIYQSSVNQPKVDDIAALMDRLGPHKRYDYDRTYQSRRDDAERTYTAVTWFFTGELAQRVRADLPAKHPTYDLLWRMTLAEKRAFLAAALAGDGSQGAKGAWQFYQNHDGDLEWFVTLLALVGWRGHKASRKAPRTGGSVSVTQHADTTLSLRNLQDDREHYEGDVWCVRVPSGAFVARRNGKVFITGNSGFPKSLDVSKAIDKAAGARREVTGSKMRPDGRSMLDARGGDESRGNGWDNPWRSDPDAVAANGMATAPATEEAARWEGFGTALKPGQEMWWLARKPFKGTVAANVLEFGTGALNIAACKVGSEARTNNAGGSSSLQRVSRVEAGYRPTVTTSEGQASEVTGRWPANIVLTHSAACEAIGVREVKNHGHSPAARGAGGIGTSGHKGQDGLTELRPGTEAIEAWSCADDCPVGELDRQSGASVSAGGSRGGTRTLFDGLKGQPDVHPGYGDTGGASRFYPTFKYQAKAPSSERPRLDDGTAHETVKPLGFMRWAVRLITPPGGTVLDLFAGSGPTGEACIIEGFPCVLIEKDPKSAELIKTRLRKPIQPVMFGLEDVS